MSELMSNALYSSIKQIIENARNNVHREVNRSMVGAYWQIGKLLVDEEQQGKHRAEYGQQLIQEISRKLTSEFGKGFSTQSLWNMRQFYQKFSSMRRELQVEEGVEILSALRRELSWTHYKVLLRVEKPEACVEEELAEELEREKWLIEMAMENGRLMLKASVKENQS